VTMGLRHGLLRGAGGEAPHFDRRSAYDPHQSRKRPPNTRCFRLQRERSRGVG